MRYSRSDCFALLRPPRLSGSQWRAGRNDSSGAANYFRFCL